MTEDEQAELLGFTGKTIDGKLYVEFKDFDRVSKWVRDILKAQEAIAEAVQKQEERKAHTARYLEIMAKRIKDFDERDMQGGQV